MCATPTAAGVPSLLQKNTHSQNQAYILTYILMLISKPGIYQRLNNWLRLVVRWPLPLSLRFSTADLVVLHISTSNPVLDALRVPLPLPHPLPDQPPIRPLPRPPLTHSDTLIYGLARSLFVMPTCCRRNYTHNRN